MNEPTQEVKIPLKHRSAWSHLQTIQRAKEIVKSWPDWKKERVFWRKRKIVGFLEVGQ